MTDWIFLSKNSEDEYINMFARGSGAQSVPDFDYSSTNQPIVLRGILKHKIMKQCWADGRDFYYVDSGYFGNNPNPLNPQGWKVWHRIVKNNLQHGNIVSRPDDRWKRFNIDLQKKRTGSKIIVAAPDEKPCKFYGIDQQQWITDTVNTIKKYSDRPVVVRQRSPNRIDRIQSDPLGKVLLDDIHALVTFNSVAAVESVLLGVPAFALSPSHAAAPVANRDLSLIETPYWPDQDKLYAWACHLAYGQFHVSELQNGTAYRILNAG
jgi:hypothetical protein